MNRRAHPLASWATILVVGACGRSGFESPQPPRSFGGGGDSIGTVSGDGGPGDTLTGDATPPGDASPGLLTSELTLTPIDFGAGGVIDYVRYTPDGSALLYMAGPGWGAQPVYRYSGAGPPVSFAIPGNPGGEGNDAYEVYDDEVAYMGVNDDLLVRANYASGQRDAYTQLAAVSAGFDTKLTRIDATGEFLALLSGPAPRQLYRFDTNTMQLFHPPLLMGGRVDDYEVTADQSRVLYVAEQDTAGSQDLYLQNIDGTGNRRLSTLAAAMRRVTDFRLTSAADRVVYRADQDNDEVYELYSTTVNTAGAPVQLNVDPVAGGDVSNIFVITPDESSVVYIADQEVDNELDMFVVPITGGASTKLYDAPVTEVYGAVPQFSFDGGDVYFSQGPPGQYQLYVVPITGGLAQNLSNTVALGSVASVRVSPTEHRVVYSADRVVDDDVELWSATPMSAPLQISGPLAMDGDVRSEFLLTPDGQTAVYRADQEVDGVYELYATDVVTGAWRKLSTPGENIGSSGTLIGSPDGSAAVYTAWTSSGAELLRVVAVDGLSPPSTASPQLFSSSMSSRIVIGGPGGLFEAAGSLGGDGLFSWTAATNAVVELVSTGPTAGGLRAWRMSPDGMTAAYVADTAADFDYELFTVSVGGGMPARRNGTLVAQGDVSTFQFNVDGTYLVYTADQNVDSEVELYSVPMLGGPTVKLNGPLGPSVRGVDDFQITPAGQVLFRMDSVAVNDPSLFIVGLDGTGPLELSPAPGGGDEAAWYDTDPSGGRVVFSFGTSAVWEIWAVDADGNNRQRIGAAAGGITSASIRQAELTGDGTRVVYIASHDTLGIDELYVANIDGSGSQRINPPLAMGRVASFVLNSANFSAIYYADTTGTFDYEVFAVELNGMNNRRVHPALVPFETIEWFDTSPSGAHVNVLIRNPVYDTYLYSFDLVTDAMLRLDDVSQHDRIYDTAYWDDTTLLFRALDRTRTALNVYRVPVAGGAVQRVVASTTQEVRVGALFPAQSAGRIVYVRSDNGVNQLKSLPFVP